MFQDASSVVALRELRRSPAAGNLRARQRKFNRFWEEFNTEPHEALDVRTPAQALPGEAGLEYPDRLEARYVSANSVIRW